MSFLSTVLKPAISSSANVRKIDIDLAIVQRVQAGEVKAFDELVHKYRERLYRSIYNLTANNSDALDLTQEAFIKAFQGLSRFKSQSSFFTWLYKIAVNTTFNYLKKNRSRRYFSFDAIDETSAPSEIMRQLATTQSSERSALLEELQEKLNESLQLLSEKHRTVVVLYEIEGLDHAEIAEVMECSEGTVRSRLHYAKEQLKVHLQAYIHS